MRFWHCCWFVALFLLAACSPASVRSIQTSQVAEFLSMARQIVRPEPVGNLRAVDPPAACPVTRPPDVPFVPPPPYPAQAPYAGYFWYGSDELWTMLDSAGTWWGLPEDDGHYVQKTVWWREGYDWRAEPQPDLTVTGRRLDGPAAPLESLPATNGYHSGGLHSFMLVGIAIPVAGCWEITGQRGEHALSIVVRVAASD